MFYALIEVPDHTLGNGHDGDIVYIKYILT